MSKAIAIRLTAFQAAVYSARNSGAFLLDFMYGTPERARMTFIFALALAALGGMMNSSEANALPVCVAS